MFVTQKRLGREPFFVPAGPDRVEGDPKSGYHQGAPRVLPRAAGLVTSRSALLVPKLVVKALQSTAVKVMLRPPYVSLWSVGHYTQPPPAERHSVGLSRRKLGRVDQEIVLADGGMPTKFFVEIQLLIQSRAKFCDGGDEVQEFEAAS